MKQIDAMRFAGDRTWQWLTFGAVIVVVFIALLRGLGAHEAPSGWSYPIECCSGHDCFAIKTDELLEQKDGSWLYTARNLKFPKASIRPSQDRHFHVCIFNGLPLCAFVLQGS
jgi:hypothetical protein